MRRRVKVSFALGRFTTNSLSTHLFRIVIPAMCGGYPSNNTEARLAPALVVHPTLKGESFLVLKNTKAARFRAFAQKAPNQRA
jgi:hypothetical protein